MDPDAEAPARAGGSPGRAPEGLAVATWLDRPRALALILLLLVCFGVGLSVVPKGPILGGAPTTGYGDAALYRDLAARVRAGEPYYQAAVSLQQLHGYPTTPFVVVRPPTLTLIRVALGEAGSTALLVTIGAVGILALGRRLERSGASRWEWIGVVALLGTNIALYAVEPIPWFAEAWAGALIMCAIGLRGRERWWPAVVLGFAAACFRELALPFLLVMAVVSLGQRRRREALGWFAAVAAVCALLAVHAIAVQAAQPTLPVASPGWVRFGGWSFVLNSVATSSVLWMLPWAAIALIVPLALFGWLFAGRAGLPVLATCCVFLAGFLFIGRSNNVYWGLLFAAVLVAGLAFVPRGVVATARAALGTRRLPPPLGG